MPVVMYPSDNLLLALSNASLTLTAQVISRQCRQVMHDPIDVNTIKR